MKVKWDQHGGCAQDNTCIASWRVNLMMYYCTVWLSLHQHIDEDEEERGGEEEEVTVSSKSKGRAVLSARCRISVLAVVYIINFIISLI